MTGFEFVILTLAAWRLAHLLVKESGPFDMFGWLRRKAGLQQIVVQNADGTTIGWSASNTLAEGLTCVWCVSIWTAALWGGLLLIPALHCWVIYAASILALSAGAIAVQEVVAFVRGAE